MVGRVNHYMGTMDTKFGLKDLLVDNLARKYVRVKRSSTIHCPGVVILDTIAIPQSTYLKHYCIVKIILDDS